jgi:hypothetical protein
VEKGACTCGHVEGVQWLHHCISQHIHTNTECLHKHRGEWGNNSLSICFSSRTCSIYTNRFTDWPRLTPIYFTPKENKYKAKKQGKHFYLNLQGDDSPALDI